jgi:hypothetical protein
MLANYAHNLIVILFALGTWFLLMIFMLSGAHNLATSNQIQNNAQMQQHLVDFWGYIPGSLGYNWTRSFTFYSFANAPQMNQNIAMSSSNEFQFSLNRTVGAPQWQSTKSVIEY